MRERGSIFRFPSLIMNVNEGGNIKRLIGFLKHAPSIPLHRCLLFFRFPTATFISIISFYLSSPSPTTHTSTQSPPPPPISNKVYLITTPTPSFPLRQVFLFFPYFFPHTIKHILFLSATLSLTKSIFYNDR